MKNENILFECSPLPKPSSPHLKHHLKVAFPDSSVVVSALLSMTMQLTSTSTDLNGKNERIKRVAFVLSV